jgi:phosphate transport system substrate-binding protein
LFTHQPVQEQARTTPITKLEIFWFSDSAHTGANKRSTIFHAPIVAAPIAVLVNLPAKKDIYLSSATVAKIFAGEITMWNDPAIVADNNRVVKSVIYRKDANGNAKTDSKGNPIVLRNTSKTIYYTLPNKPIKVVFRSDTSGNYKQLHTLHEWCGSISVDKAS